MVQSGGFCWNDSVCEFYCSKQNLCTNAPLNTLYSDGTVMSQKCTAGRDCYSGCCASNGTCLDECEPGASCLANTNTAYGFLYWNNSTEHSTNLLCNNSIAKLPIGSTQKTNSGAGCTSGFAEKNVCIGSGEAKINSLCSWSVYPTCNCVNGVCKSFSVQGWASAMLCFFAALVLGLGYYATTLILEYRKETSAGASRQ